jgi:class 3 adenylate cyclase
MSDMNTTHRGYGTVLLAELCGVAMLASQRGYEQAFQAVRSSLDRITETACGRGGSVDDGFGDWLLTTFDVSSAATDGPQAALAAALAMRSEVAGFARGSHLPIDFSLRIGVDLGPVVCGARDDAVTDDFAVMGEAVRGATELKDLAPQGRIYVDPDTYRATRNEFVFREILGPVDPDKRGWLPARELLGDAAAPQGDAAVAPPATGVAAANPLACIRSPWVPSREDDVQVFSAAFYFPAVSSRAQVALALEPPSRALPELLALAAAVFGSAGN